MADFGQAYSKVSRWEGGYVNHPNDGGGETHRGITRKNHADWPGWEIINEIKKAGGDFKSRIDANQELKDLARQFYREKIWNPGEFGQIKDQSIAEIMFDWGVLTTPKRSWGFAERLGAASPEAINALDAAERKTFHQGFKDLRERHHRNRVREAPDQVVFLEGWLNRNDSYTYGADRPTAKKEAKAKAGWIIPLLLIGGGALTTLYSDQDV